MAVERPIIFQAEMVRAILAGTKTQTRRVMKPQIEIRHDPDAYYWSHPKYDNGMGVHYFHSERISTSVRKLVEGCCPYGKPGDRLWVRETFRPISVGDMMVAKVEYRADDAQIEIENSLVAADRWRELGPPEPHHEAPDKWARWRPSIFMPRWVSRIELEIISVRFQQVTAISVADCFAEGMTWAREIDELLPRAQFARLWDSINAKSGHPFVGNPWVWVVEFNPIKIRGKSNG